MQAAFLTRPSRPFLSSLQPRPPALRYSGLWYRRVFSPQSKPGSNASDHGKEDRKPSMPVYANEKEEDVGETSPDVRKLNFINHTHN